MAVAALVIMTLFQGVYSRRPCSVVGGKADDWELWLHRGTIEGHPDFWGVWSNRDNRMSFQGTDALTGAKNRINRDTGLGDDYNPMARSKRNPSGQTRFPDLWIRRVAEFLP
jgi:hypothetical protein